MDKKNGYVTIKVQESKPNGENHVTVKAANHETLTHSERLGTSVNAIKNIEAQMRAFNGLYVTYQVQNQFEETITVDELENPDAKEIILNYLRSHPATAALIISELKKPI